MLQLLRDFEPGVEVICHHGFSPQEVCSQGLPQPAPAQYQEQQEEGQDDLGLPDLWTQRGHGGVR